MCCALCIFVIAMEALMVLLVGQVTLEIPVQ